jgi:hypothetical protein
MLLLVLLRSLRGGAGGNGTINAPVANISQIQQTLVIDYTETIVYRVSPSPYQTYGLTNILGQGETSANYTAYTLLVTFVASLLRVRRVMIVTPAPTLWHEVPPPTRELRFFLFKPYFLPIGSFVLVFLGGALWTYQCKKSVQVLAPPGALDGNASSSDELDDVSKSGSGKRSGSSRARSGTTRARSGTRRVPPPPSSRRKQTIRPPPHSRA